MTYLDFDCDTRPSTSPLEYPLFFNSVINSSLFFTNTGRFSFLNDINQ